MRRSPKYFAPEDRHRDRWLLSYTDVLTVLLVLFIALAAHGFQDGKIVRASSEEKLAVKDAEPQANTQPPEKSSAMLQIQAALQQLGLEPTMEDRGLVISLPQTVLFRSGDSHVSPEALPVIQQIAEVIRDVPNRINLIGHADSVPVHNRLFADNWDLSAARSLQLLQVLTGRFGIDESRLAIMSYGSQSPRSSNDTQDGRAANRRVEIVIVD